MRYEKLTLESCCAIFKQNKTFKLHFSGVWCGLAPGGCGDLPEAGESPGGAAEAAGGGAAAE